MVKQITRLPVAPSRARPAQFSDEGDAFLGALPDFGDEANELALEVNASAIQVSQDKADIVGIIADAIDTAITSSTGVAQGYANAAAQSASDAGDSATQADLSKLAANQFALDAANSVQQAGDVAGASKWVAGTYTQGGAVWSPISYFTYRRTTPGNTSSTTDPFLDASGWKRVGVPSFTQTVLNGVGPHQLYAGGHYLLMTPDATLVMPLLPSIGDEVRVSNLSGNKGAILQRNGETFKGLAEDLVINSVIMDYTFTKTENEGWI